MDWQATEFNNAWRYAFMSLVRKSPEHQDPAALQAGVASWNRHVQILESQLQRTGAYVAGSAFTLADIVIGLSAQRWLAAPIDAIAPRPDLPAVRAYRDLLMERPGFLLHGANSHP